LAKVTARWVAGLHREHDRLMSRTLALGAFELLYGDPGLIYDIPERITAVGQDAVSAAAKSLRPDSRAVLTITPAGGGE
jgi:hypothetical protein